MNFGNFAKINNFEAMLTVARSRNVRYTLFLQSFSQLEDKYSKEKTQNILDNCATWIYLKSANIDTANKISEKLGSYTTKSYSESSNGKLSNLNSSMSLISRKLLTADEVLKIERPYVLLMHSGQEPAISYLPDLNGWYFNKLDGLGDKEHNRILRKNLEDAREVRGIRKFKVWKIWENCKQSTTKNGKRKAYQDIDDEFYEQYLDEVKEENEEEDND